MNRFLQVSLGISIVLVSTAIFLFSVKSLTADPVPVAPVPQDASGEYRMNYNTFAYEDGDIGYNVQVYNTKTGESVIYYYSYNEDKMKKWESGYLPANPLD